MPTKTQTNDEVPRATALAVGAFLDELCRWGLREVVVSPGSRSTPLAMCAFELSRREPARLRLYVDVDERSAGFFALGLAKASGRPVALVCTSGSALANYYPAVLEAESSRVPLVVLSGDRPQHMQGLGAPQTCDQLKAYGDHVRRFISMPLAEGTPRSVAFARQAAREAAIAASGAASWGNVDFEAAVPVPEDAEGSSPAERSDEGRVQVASRGCSRMAGPVQVNFPFDEPLKPDLSAPGLFECGRSPLDLGKDGLSPVLCAPARLTLGSSEDFAGAIKGRRTLVLAGEGSCETLSEARELAYWAKRFALPLLADPLSGLRSLNEPLVVDAYDAVFADPAFCEGDLAPELVIRFGRYPVSKRCFTALAALRPAHVVVDAGQTRDFNLATDLFVPCSPIDFARSFFEDETWLDDVSFPDDGQACFAWSWQDANKAAAAQTADDDGLGLEDACVQTLLRAAPAGSCVFSANSMAIRRIDARYRKGAKPLALLCNRGLNGIDGTVSTALGAAQHFAQATFITGDLTLQHDIGALALQRELLKVAADEGRRAPSCVIVALSNNGGGIFDRLPQKSSEPYFERLFTTPQDVRFGHAAAAFGVPYREVGTATELEEAYRECLGVPGISLIEVKAPAAGGRAL